MTAAIGDVFISTNICHHDRRIPIPGFTGKCVCVCVCVCVFVNACNVILIMIIVIIIHIIFIIINAIALIAITIRRPVGGRAWEKCSSFFHLHP